MMPIRCNISQRHKNKGALADTRMREQRPTRFNLTVVIQKIDIQAARRVSPLPNPPKLGFDVMQRVEKCGRIEDCFDHCDSIDESWI